MSSLDLEAEYNNRERVPEHAGHAKRWAEASAAYRTVARAELDLAYGPLDRNRYDLFHAGSGTKPAAVLIYIHGGYWQRGDRREHSWIARELNAAGVSVAIPSYSLCPAVSVMDIVGEMRACVKAVWQTFDTRMAVAGHSAGGHLTAAMLATDWSAHGIAGDAVRAAYAISGAFDPEPLLATTINAALGLTPETARTANVVLWPAPTRGKRFVAAVGGDESSEFLRQGRDIVAAWSSAGVTAETVVVPRTNHFTVVDELGLAHSAMTVRITEMARWAAIG